MSVIIFLTAVKPCSNHQSNVRLRVDLPRVRSSSNLSVRFSFDCIYPSGVERSLWIAPKTTSRFFKFCSLYGTGDQSMLRLRKPSWRRKSTALSLFVIVLTIKSSLVFPVNMTGKLAMFALNIPKAVLCSAKFSIINPTTSKTLSKMPSSTRGPVKCSFSPALGREWMPRKFSCYIRYRVDGPSNHCSIYADIRLCRI